jgi:RHS repeat-associated protein
VPLHEWQSTKEEPKIDIITWVFEDGSFVPCARLTETSKESIVTDYLGTPTQMYDETGKKTWETDLDIYGRIRTFAGRSLKDCPFRYAGMYEDAETGGLCYQRFRYYDTESGNYISQDPSGLDGGIVLYAYVHDPNNWIDPFGLKKYIVYQAEDLNNPGKIYTGRTSGADNMTREQILAKRKSNHHKNLGEMDAVFETNNYGAVRGGEHYHIEQTKKAGQATGQIRGIADRNFSKNGKKLKGDKYMDAFYNESPDLKPKSHH